jgi:hypothetical protein
MTPLERQLQLAHAHSKYEVIAEVARELAMRKKLFPAWCATGRITVSVAADRIHLLEMALTDLQALYREEAQPPPTPQQISLFPIQSEPISQFRS